MGTDEKCLPADVQARRKVIGSAAEHLKQLTAQRFELTKEIQTTKRTISGLVEMFGTELVSDDVLRLLKMSPRTRSRGLTDACRDVLLESTKPLRAVEVVDQIVRSAPDLLKSHKMPVASVTTVLNRLVEYGEARAETTNGRRFYLSVAERPAETQP